MPDEVLSSALRNVDAAQVLGEQIAVAHDNAG